MGYGVSFKKEFGLIVVGAIVFTASFMWKDLLLEIEEEYFPKGNGIGGRLLFTTLVTLFLIWIAVHLKSVWGLNGASSENPLDNDPNIIVDHTTSANHGIINHSDGSTDHYTNLKAH